MAGDLRQNGRGFRRDSGAARVRLHLPEPVTQRHPGAASQGLNDLVLELVAKDREIQELRDQLRAIHNSELWAVLRTLSQIRHALAPRGTLRDHFARGGIRGLRRIKKAVAQLSLKHRLDRRSSWARISRVVDLAPRRPEAYPILCLPMIEWDFRFQRPQQLMRQFALGGHAVIYAANHFHGGTEARLRSIEPGIVEAVLPGDAAANVYQALPSNSEVQRMAHALTVLAREENLGHAVTVAQLPYWSSLAEALRSQLGWPIVYDCMDEHGGFLHNTPAVLDEERRLIRSADLVIASSERLLRSVERCSRKTLLVRNGCDFEHFGAIHNQSRERGPSPLVGYYGAISEWFDAALVADLARIRAGWQFELIGSTLAGDVRCLDDLPNVRFLGERPYAELPRLIRRWDVFLIPFKRILLTEATNPVKVYEMLATGKPVVAVPLPELVPIADLGLIRLAEDAPGFDTAILSGIAESTSDLVERRREFARRNTWQVRHQALSHAISHDLFRRVARASAS